MYTFYVVHVLYAVCIIIREKSDKNAILKVEFWGWVMFIFSNLVGWVTKACAITRGWVMCF